MKFLRKLDQTLFAKPSAREIAVSDLEEARRNLIKEIAASEYHKRMVDYYYALISELEEKVN
jgi:hypothetical protein